MYLITSREEGGPRAVLESMATGVPIVSTSVGQAVDLIKHKHNGYLVDIEDSENLAYWSNVILNNDHDKEQMVINAKKNAQNNDYIS